MPRIFRAIGDEFNHGFSQKDAEEFTDSLPDFDLPRLDFRYDGERFEEALVVRFIGFGRRLICVRRRRHKRIARRNKGDTRDAAVTTAVEPGGRACVVICRSGRTDPFGPLWRGGD
jgi:hypothetical protein